MKYTEEQLKEWTAPLSDTEDNRAKNAITMIKSAIDSSTELKRIDIEVFLQGSYANNTNIRGNSDVDVCVMCKSTFYYSLVEGLQASDYGIIPGSISFHDYKERVLRAIKAKFGHDKVVVGNKSIKIKSNSYHVNADVVPAFMFKDYSRIGSKEYDNYTEGIKLYSEDGNEVVNYPKIHIQNGINKNNKTNHRYKKLVRIVKNVRADMVDDKIIDGDKITSFLVECLVWNFANSQINKFSSYTDLLERFISTEWNQIDRNEHSEWGEVSECLYLFRYRKWTDHDAKDFLLKMWNYLGYGD